MKAEQLQEHVPILVFGFDYDESGQNAGPGTRLRCVKGAQLYFDLRSAGKYPLLIVTAGRAQKVSADTQPKTMAQMMRAVFVEWEVHYKDIVLADDETVWGTRGELLAGAIKINQWKREGYRISEAYLVSNRLHLWRISVLADWVRLELKLPWCWRYSACKTFVTSWNTKERLKEIAKCGVEVLYAWRWFLSGAGPLMNK